MTPPPFGKSKKKSSEFVGEDFPKVSLLTRVTSVKSTSMSRLELPATFEFVCMSLCPYLCCLKTHFAVPMHYSQVKQYILGIVHFPFRQRFNVTYRYASSRYSSKITIGCWRWSSHPGNFVLPRVAIPLGCRGKHLRTFILQARQTAVGHFGFQRLHSSFIET